MSLLEKIVEKFIDIIENDSTFNIIMIWFVAVIIFQLITE